MKVIRIRIKNELLMWYICKFIELTKRYMSDLNTIPFYAYMISCDVKGDNEQHIDISLSCMIRGCSLFSTIINGTFESRSFDDRYITNGQIVNISDDQEKQLLEDFKRFFHNARQKDAVQKCLDDISAKKNLQFIRNIKNDAGQLTKLFGFTVNVDGTVTEFMYEEAS